MSNDSRSPTLVATLGNVVVLIGGGPRLGTASSDAAMAASGARLRRCELKNATTACAEERPYAIIVPQDIYDFCGSELDALARDVSAGLVVVPETVARSVLQALLQEEAMRLG